MEVTSKGRFWAKSSKPDIKRIERIFLRKTFEYFFQEQTNKVHYLPNLIIKSDFTGDQWTQSPLSCSGQFLFLLCSFPLQCIYYPFEEMFKGWITKYIALSGSLQCITEMKCWASRGHFGIFSLVKLPAYSSSRGYKLLDM